MVFLIPEVSTFQTQVCVRRKLVDQIESNHEAEALDGIIIKKDRSKLICQGVSVIVHPAERRVSRSGEEKRGGR